MTHADDLGERSRPHSPSAARDAVFKSPDLREMHASSSSSARGEPYRRGRPLDGPQRLSPAACFRPDMPRKRAAPRSPADDPPPSLIQRRGEAKVPRLVLDARPEGAAHPAPYEAAPSLPAAHSAPAHQRAFGPDARLPSPSHLFRAREREPGRIPHHLGDLELPRKTSPTPSSPYEPGSAHRLSVPHLAMSSPAFHSSHIGHGTRPEHLAASDAESEALPPRSPANKMQFLSLFSDFFDSLSDSRTLKATLEHQIRASNALLQSLQRSNHVFDETVDLRIREASQAWESRFARLEEHLERLETRLNDALSHLSAPASHQANPEASSS